MPAGEWNQKPMPGQKIPLSTQRQASSIPKGDVTPPHQHKDSETWVFPSPQMFYNAMKNKGWKPDEKDMETVVAIHNSVNERAWSNILAWEQLHRGVCLEPKLLRFQGRPDDASLKSSFKHYFQGAERPFDRHDWVIDRCGTHVRYIIDFYRGTRGDSGVNGSLPVSIYLDVRPALDSFSNICDRLFWMPLLKFKTIFFE